jgi:hypothetical protein
MILKFLVECRYTVPAAGDWSLRRAAAVTVDGAVDASLARCTWARVGGNGLLVTGAARNVTVDDADFFRPGGSAIAVVGCAQPRLVFLLLLIDLLCNVIFFAFQIAAHASTGILRAEKRAC